MDSGNGLPVNLTCIQLAIWHTILCLDMCTHIVFHRRWVVLHKDCLFSNDRDDVKDAHPVGLIIRGLQRMIVRMVIRARRAFTINLLLCGRA